MPDCAGKVCGSDGCGSNCGSCPQGWGCATDGAQCNPKPGASCGPFGGSAGRCTDGDDPDLIPEILWFCVDGVLYQQDCALTNQICAFDAAKNKNACRDLP